MKKLFAWGAALAAAAVLTGCAGNEFSVEGKEWRLRTVLDGSANEIEDAALAVTAEDGLLTVEGGNVRYEGDYAVEVRRGKSVIYRITGREGYGDGIMSVGETTYHDAPAQYTLVITLGEYSLWFDADQK